jgi:predicted transcriptional regulator
MSSKILGVHMRSAQLQIVSKEQAGETILIRLKRKNGYSWTKGSKRDRLEILAEILLCCDQQQTKTSIMYKTNLNYAQLKKHLAYLTTQGLLGRSLKKYVTTEKGYRFLGLFAQMNDMLRKR